MDEAQQSLRQITKGALIVFLGILCFFLSRFIRVVRISIFLFR